MARSYSAQLDAVSRYYDKPESRWGYRWLLGGTRHYGYYPSGKYIRIKDAHHEMEHRLVRALALPADSLVLDAGSGEGRVALRLSQNAGVRVRGIDIHPPSVARAQALARQHPDLDVSFSQGDFAKSIYPGDSFDGVFTLETLVHSPDYRAALREFHRVLRPGGKVALFEYSIAGPLARSRTQERLWKEIAAGSGMHSLMDFEHGRLAEALRDAGFVDVDNRDITKFTLPMLRLFYVLGWLPYQAVKRLRLERRFPNTAAAAGVYRDIIDNRAWQYNIVTAAKPT